MSNTENMQGTDSAMGKRPLDTFAQENPSISGQCREYVTAVTECNAASLALDEEERNLATRRSQLTKKRKIATAVFNGALAETEFDYYRTWTRCGYSINVLSEAAVNLIQSTLVKLHASPLIVEKKHAAFIDLDDATKERFFDGSVTIRKLIYTICVKSDFNLIRVSLKKGEPGETFYESVFVKLDEATRMYRRIGSEFEGQTKSGKFKLVLDHVKIDEFPESILDVVTNNERDFDEEMQKIKNALKKQI